MTDSKFTTGAFVFTRARGLQLRDPGDLQPIAHQHGLLADIIPACAGDRVSIQPHTNVSKQTMHVHKEDIFETNTIWWSHGSAVHV